MCRMDPGVRQSTVMEANHEMEREEPELDKASIKHSWYTECAPANCSLFCAVSLPASQQGTSSFHKQIKT